MKTGNDSITLNQVRSVMNMLAQKYDCSIAAIEIAQVQSEIGKGSNGTVGAFVKQVKQEHINAKAYDRSNISTQLKSALMEEIDRFADNARENATEELGAVESLNDELRGKIDRADETIDGLKEDLQSQQATSNKEARRLSDELVKANEKNDSHTGIIEGQNADLDSCRSELAEKNIEISTLNKQIGTMETELKTARSEASAASNDLAQTISSRNEVEKNAALAEQQAAHQQQTIDLLTAQASKLEQRHEELKKRVTELTTQNSQLHQKIDEVNRGRLEDLKTIRSHADTETATDNVPSKDEKTPATADKRRKTK